MGKLEIEINFYKMKKKILLLLIFLFVRFLGSVMGQEWRQLGQDIDGEEAR